MNMLIYLANWALQEAWLHYPTKMIDVQTWLFDCDEKFDRNNTGNVNMLQPFQMHSEIIELKPDIYFCN